MTNQYSDNPTNRQLEEDKLRSQDADLQDEAILGETTAGSNTANKETAGDRTCPYSFLPLHLEGRSHRPSAGTNRLMSEQVSLADLETMTTLFYDKAFRDATLDKFIRSHEDPHGARFAKWIHQKLSSTSRVWDDDRRQRGPSDPVHDRTSAHVAAWYSPKRPPSERGRHFQLDECRVWMRLHFWALRESGLVERSPTFADYYVRFIGHFVNVYESTAPVFARESWRWSADPTNIETYIQNGRCMKDVLGLSLEEAEAQLPEKEANDFMWPYYQTDPSSI